MKNVFKLKAVLALLLFSGMLTSCSKEELDPVLDIRFTMEQTDQFEYAEIAFRQLFLYEGSNGEATSKSNLQNQKDQVMNGFLLNNKSSHTLTVTSHFTQQVVALEADMDFYLHVTNDGGLVTKVYESLGDRKIFLEQPVTLEPNQTYQIDFTMDLEDALVLKDDQLAIDWSQVTASLTKK
ncbi:MAG: hypothetical protein JJ975_08005 [Bacteroidia bacterium]|nr:hypothetical protein [Bacteroidia bacterium]